MSINWDDRINIAKKIYLKAEFLLSVADIELAILSAEIFVKGRYYKIPKEQLKNAKAGLIILELEEIT